ncbi:pentatricopeptide repeat-containing protein At5g09450, mitochondrial-like [Phragmites australis]|uniref:pentatricopeptide repeat-containing protein At5g09450, mitochondrial-like n=1 Tax=Phragmites australis TaxID=29695 RepID=UPI002D7974DF|nr:pentatricopeptide repeat-containing protein At5g09450, mitochondrial-like [Phragmites australis]
MAAMLLRAAARATRRSCAPLRSILARQGLFSSEATEPFSVVLTLSPAAAGDDDGGAGAGQEENDDLRSRIFRLGLAKRSATAALEKWAGEGRAAPAAEELRRIARDLRRARRYKHALEVADWMKTHHESDLSESDYGMRIDLITKVFGANAAEDFFEKLPPGAKSLEAHTALLHSYARSKMTDKAERLFERMKDANMSMDVLVYNEMMTLYISVGELDKVQVVAEELKRQNVSPDLFTYNLRISAATASMDFEGFKGILDEMSKDPNSNEGWALYRNLAAMYVDASQLVCSRNPLVEAEAKISQRDWITYDFLVILHTGLGNRERIKDIWKSMLMTSQRMTSRNYICVLSSHLMCGQLKDAGEIVDQWQRSKAPEFDISACNRLLDAFLTAGFTDTANSFRELMLQKGCILTSRAGVAE